LGIHIVLQLPCGSVKVDTLVSAFNAGLKKIAQRVLNAEPYLCGIHIFSRQPCYAYVSKFIRSIWAGYIAFLLLGCSLSKSTYFVIQRLKHH
jgi:hypothetical protein